MKTKHSTGNQAPATDFEYKQVMVIRTDLKMSRGKLAVQVAHAAVSGAEDARRRFPTWWRRWLYEGQKKVVVKVPNLEALQALVAKAERLSIPSSLIQDRGLTELPAGTTTVLSIGPAPNSEADKITGHLPLL